MGVEAAAIIGAASAAYGANQQRKARKGAKRAASEQQAVINEQREVTRKEQSRLGAQLERSQKRIEIGNARANRRRSRGGLFGDAQAAPQTLSSRLG